MNKLLSADEFRQHNVDFIDSVQEEIDLYAEVVRMLEYKALGQYEDDPQYLELRILRKLYARCNEERPVFEKNGQSMILANLALLDEFHRGIGDRKHGI